MGWGSTPNSLGGPRVSTASRAAVFTLGLQASAASAPSTAHEPSTEPARLQVWVAFPEGETPAAPYVAVVAETAPWAEAVREAVLEAGQPQVWELAPGRYRVVAGAPGYTLEYLPVFELEAGGSRTERLDLARLVPVPGRVTDEQGPGLNLPAVLAIWARPVGAPAEPGRAWWSSLPPGRYEVWLKAPLRGSHDLVPLRLGVVELAAGRSRDLGIALPEPTGAAPAVVEGAPGLRLLTSHLPEDELGSLEVHRWRGDTRAERTFAATAVSGGLLLEVEGGCRSGSLLVLESEARVGSVQLRRRERSGIQRPAEQLQQRGRRRRWRRLLHDHRGRMVPAVVQLLLRRVLTPPRFA